MSNATASGGGILGEILTRHGVLTSSRLASALAEQAARGGRLGTVLVDAGFCTEEQIARALAAQFSLAFVIPLQVDVHPEATATLGIEFQRRHGMLALRGTGKVLRLAVADPLDVETIDRAQALLHTPVETVVATRRDIFALLDAQGALGEHLSAPGVATVHDSDTEIAPTVDEVLTKGVRLRATDVHFEADERVFRVRYRIDGVLRQGATFPKEKGARIVARIKVLCGLDICEHRLPQDGRARLNTQGGQVDMRISVLPTIHGEGCVVRLLDTNRAVLLPSALEMPARVNEPLLRLIQRPHGMILITGPTGSGKTTTLYSLLSTIDAMEKKVITVEDPVEYAVPMIRQCQVKSEIGFTFGNALRAILRHDPEVILIGEIRDRETAEIATRAALTGHLVLSTLHTNSSAGAVPRLLDIGIDPFLLNSTIIAIAGQRLVRRLCRDCRIRTPMTGDERRALPAGLESTADDRHAAVGCNACGHTGFNGRLGIYELVLPDDDFRAQVAARASEGDLAAVATGAGYRPMTFDGAEKILAGKTTAAEVARVTWT